MRLYTFYTDTHSKLLNEYFLPSIPKEDNFEVIVEKFPQECPSGNFMHSGWMDTMTKKIQYVLKSISECYGDVFIHADCDIEFYKPFKNNILQQLEHYDIAGIEDGPNNMCCGFFICRANEQTKKLFEAVKNNIHRYGNDQMAFNELKHQYIKSKFLDKKYYNVSFSIGQQVWNPGVQISHVDKNIFLTHANFTVGVQNKYTLLDTIKTLLK